MDFESRFMEQFFKTRRLPSIRLFNDRVDFERRRMEFASRQFQYNQKAAELDTLLSPKDSRIPEREQLRVEAILLKQEVVSLKMAETKLSGIWPDLLCLSHEHIQRERDFCRLYEELFALWRQGVQDHFTRPWGANLPSLLDKLGELAEELRTETYKKANELQDFYVELVKKQEEYSNYIDRESAQRGKSHSATPSDKLTLL